MTSPFDALLAYQRKARRWGALHKAGGIETVMPAGSGDDRSEEMAALEGDARPRQWGGIG